MASPGTKVTNTLDSFLAVCVFKIKLLLINVLPGSSTLWHLLKLLVKGIKKMSCMIDFLSGSDPGGCQDVRALLLAVVVLAVGRQWHHLRVQPETLVLGAWACLLSNGRWTKRDLS